MVVMAKLTAPRTRSEGCRLWGLSFAPEEGNGVDTAVLVSVSEIFAKSKNSEDDSEDEAVEKREPANSNESHVHKRRGSILKRRLVDGGLRHIRRARLTASAMINPRRYKHFIAKYLFILRVKEFGTPAQVQR